jgi:hypothetical protein
MSVSVKAMLPTSDPERSIATATMFEGVTAIFDRVCSCVTQHGDTYQRKLLTLTDRISERQNEKLS